MIFYIIAPGALAGCSLNVLLAVLRLRRQIRSELLQRFERKAEFADSHNLCIRCRISLGFKVALFHVHGRLCSSDYHNAPCSFRVGHFSQLNQGVVDTPTIEDEEIDDHNKVNWVTKTALL